MAGSKEIKSRMDSIRDTMKITNAMYLISSAKLRRAREQQEKVSRYFKTMRSAMARAMYHLPPDEHHRYVTPCTKAEPRKGYLVLTADKGMAGAFNANILKYATQLCENQPNARLYVVGQTGYRYFYHKDGRLVEDFRYSGESPNLARARHITFELVDAFDNGELDEIDLIYTHMKNALTAEPRTLPLLPLRREVFTGFVEGGRVDFFPSARSVLNQTAPIYMHGVIFSALTESYCAEQNARMVAMDSSTKNAKKMLQELQLQYNRTRQCAITQELTEIVGGAAALQENQEVV